MKSTEAKSISDRFKKDPMNVFKYIVDQANSGKNELHIGLNKWEQPKLIRLGYGCKKLNGNWYLITW